LNYIDHCKEANLPVPTEPVLFSKFTTSICGPYDDLSWPPAVTKEVDYEVEMAVVIGRTARDVAEKDALDYVLGYTGGERRVGARPSVHRRQAVGQVEVLRYVLPVRPVHRDARRDHRSAQPAGAHRAERKEMQNSNTKNLIFNVNQIIAYASQGTTLLPGDLIPTGTPFGVGFSRKPPVFLKDGTSACARWRESAHT
jgi:2-keto-4-pentenoate hydratase/2-oxohepta-3-ene-1,7-dioic acid hydratase in catechol pathway